MLSIPSTCTNALPLRPWMSGEGAWLREFGTEKVQDNGSVFVFSALERLLLPPLTFIATQVVEVERAIGLTRLMKIPLYSY